MERNNNINVTDLARKSYGVRRNQHISYAIHKAIQAAKEAEEVRRMAQEVARRRAEEACRAAQRAALRKAPEFCLRRAERELRWV